jgi:hypothetical protein
MSLQEAFAETEAHHRNLVMHATWGHLGPDHTKVYKASLQFTRCIYDGSVCYLKSDIKGLPDSPWLFQHLMAYADKHSKAGRVTLLEGTYRITKTGRGIFKGKLTTIKI